MQVGISANEIAKEFLKHDELKKQLDTAVRKCRMTGIHADARSWQQLCVSVQRIMQGQGYVFWSAPHEDNMPYAYIFLPS